MHQTLTVAGSGIVVAHHAVFASTFFGRMRGLLGRTALPDGAALIVHPTRRIHTWGMTFPIDVVFVDREWRVIRILPSMGPWRISPLVRRAVAAIELPATSAESLETGDQLSVTPR